MYEAVGLVSKLGSEGIASPVHVASSQFAAIVFKFLNDRDSVEFPPVSEKTIEVVLLNDTTQLLALDIPVPALPSSACTLFFLRARERASARERL